MKPTLSVPVRFAGIMLLVMVLPFIIILVITTNRLSVIQQDGAEQYLSSNLRTVSSTVDQTLKSLEFTHTIIFQDPDFLNAIKQISPYDTREEYRDFLNTGAIKSRISEAAATNDYIHSIYAYSFPAQRIFSSRVNWDPTFNHFPPHASPWLNTHRENIQKHPWCFTTDIRDDEQMILSSYREIWIYGNESPVGLLSVNIDADVITQMLNEVTPQSSGYTFIIDNKNSIISNQKDTDNAIFRQIIQHRPTDVDSGSFGFHMLNETMNGELVDDDTNEDRNMVEMFASFYTSPYSGFTYVIATPLDQIQTAVPVMLQLILLFLLLIVALSVCTMILIYRVLAMTKNMQALTLENYTSQLVNKEAELRNIQNQLNEHFLYNTLDSIHWLARGGNNRQVCDMVFSLANFYRQSLSSGKEVIPIKDVIEMTKNYLFIQAIRMGDSLEYHLSCSPGLEDEPILKTLLQPLVENAIVHGFRGLSHPGVISITLTEQGDKLRIEVRDNGVGFLPEQLLKVRQQLTMGDPYCDHSFALKTIQSQAQIYYGEDIRLNIETNVGAGSVVWLDLPLSRM